MVQQGGNGAGPHEGFGQTLVSPSATEDTLVGQVLDGRYRIERVLGEGGMGLVYKAVHTTLGKPLAVKVLRAEVSRDEQIVARFRQEAQSASSIGNQHIIDISDFGALSDGSTYFVMEFLSGQSLTGALEQGKLSTSRTIHIAKQLCSALGAAHEIGIVHRDLKPDNIQLIERGGDPDFVKVLDFGIAKVGGGNSKLTQAGQVFGTPHYMSPEQCAGTNVDHRTDIYALGIILYEMATGQVPFDADNLMGILTKHLYENPIPPHELPPPQDVPAALEAVIMKALAKTPEARYQSMAEVAKDLDAIEAGATPSAVLEQVERGSTTNAPWGEARATGLSIGVGEPQLPVRKPILPIAIGLVALLVVGGGVALFFATGGEDEAQAHTVEPAPEPTAAPEPEPESEPEPEPERVVAKVTITSAPQGVEVYQGDALLGNTPFEVQRPEDDRGLLLQLRKPGYKNQNVRISALTADTVNISLEKVEVAKPEPKRRPRVRARKPRPKQRETETASKPKPQRRPGLGPGSEVLDPWQ